MAACQALDLKEQTSGLGKGTQAAYDFVRKQVDFIELDKDIEIYDELNKVSAVLEDGSLLKAVEEAVSLDIQ